MPEIIIRVGVLILVSLLAWLLTWSGRRFVNARRRQALTAAPPTELSGTSYEHADSPTQGARDLKGALQAAHPGDDEAPLRAPTVRILAFSSADCHQCHQLQAPALRRVQEIHGTNVSVVEVDAPDSPELTERYRVLTVPTTVVLDASGRAHAVNYGFANTRRLLEQVNGVLAQTAEAVS